MGPDNFYKYIRDFGFGSRTGTELPGETRGLLRAPKHWGSTSIGSIAIGKAADLIVIKGDPSKNITDIEKVEIVFKDGIGYDSAKLFEAAKGRVGLN